MDHGVGGSDDYANVLFGAMRMTTKRRPRSTRPVTVSPQPVMIFIAANITAAADDTSSDGTSRWQTTTRSQ